MDILLPHASAIPNHKIVQSKTRTLIRLTLPVEILHSFQIEDKPDELEQEAENEEEVKYKPLVDVVDNPIFRFENTKQNNDKNPFLPEQAIYINLFGLFTIFRPTYVSVSLDVAISLCPTIIYISFSKFSFYVG